MSTDPSRVIHTYANTGDPYLCEWQPEQATTTRFDQCDAMQCDVLWCSCCSSCATTRWQELPFEPYVQSCIQQVISMTGKGGSQTFPKKALHKTQNAGVKRAKYYVERFNGGDSMVPHQHEHLVPNEVIQEHRNGSWVRNCLPNPGTSMCVESERTVCRW